MSIEIIAFIMVSLGFSFLFIQLLRLRVKYQKISVDFAQAVIDKNIIIKKIEEFESNKIESTNEFTSFLSQSRDWAFTYIEDVQNKIKNMTEDAAREIAYFEKFGLLTEQYPNHDLAKKFVKHYRELEKMLPEEGKNA